MNRPLALCVFATVLLSGCQGMNAEQCALADWHAMGFKDGSAGLAQSRLVKHQKVCANHGVAADSARYREGWQEGVLRYCTPHNGYAQGKAGASYGNVCPDNLAHGFLDAYADGRRVYTVGQELKQLRNTLTRVHSDIDAIEDDLAQIEDDLIHDESLTAVDRYRLIEDSKELSKEQGYLENEVERLLEAIDAKEAQYEHLNAELAYR